VEGRHRLQAIQRLRYVYPEVGYLQRWDFRYHTCSLRIARECDLILQDRRPAHGLDLLLVFTLPHRERGQGEEASHWRDSSMYSSCDIDKVRARGETWAVDLEMREAFDRLGADLRGEMQTFATELRGEIQTSAADLRGEVRTFATELRGEIQTFAADLRGEIQTSATDLRGEIQTYAFDLRGEIQTSAAETRAYVDARLQTTTVEMRRHFEVVGESLRSDIRAVAEGVVLLGQRMDRGFAEQAGQVGGLDRRVSRLEVRVKSLEDERKPRRARRRR